MAEKEYSGSGRKRMSGSDYDLEIDGNNNSEVMREAGCGDVPSCSRCWQQGGKGQRLWGASGSNKMAREVECYWRLMLASSMRLSNGKQR
ncbi:hypothetical protein B296_00034977 [Ensete ventricosum]|uniref:Uncharacterized protein n=1 Tax=Ensete ventricosum TaxID=4639 RepID=A0A427A378_ENSVE|nr:hypothetical protein B296_00034977 [Ensete ventricosum]